MKNLKIVVLVSLILLALIMAGGCGGADGETFRRNSAILIGTLHGELAPYLHEKMGLTQAPSGFDGPADELGDVVLLSVPEGLTASNGNLPLMKEAFDLGKAVVLENVNAKEVDVLLEALGMGLSFPAPDGAADVELFAVRRIGGNNFFFVTLNDDGGGPVSADVPERTITIVGPEDNPTDVQVTTKLVKEEDVDGNCSDIQRSRVENFLAWTKKGAELPPSNGMSTDLRELAEANVWDIDCSNRGQTFTIRYTIYSCHSFTNDLDYYLISQSAQLNPSALWKWTERGHVGGGYVHCPRQQGHMRRYSFKNYWGEDPGSPAPLDRHSPESANNVTTVTSGVSYSLSGSLGFDGKAATGSLSGGVSFESSTSFAVSDCTVRDMGGGDGRRHQAAWEYVFANPANGSTYFYYTELEDAPTLARANFQPVNQWIWVVPSSFTERWWDNLKFKTEFTWVNGKSEGQLNAFWIKREDAVHRDWLRDDLNFWVPVNCPPRMALSAGQMDFTAAGESKAVTFVSARNWTASTDSTWCSVQETSGNATSAEGISLHVTASPNTGGANRTATVTLRGTDNREIRTLKVFQSQY